MLPGAISAVVALLWCVLAVPRAPPPLKTPLIVYTAFYVLTTAIGATALAIPLVRQLWIATYPTMDAAWITPGDSWGYWFLVWGPLPITATAAMRFYPRLRTPVALAVRMLGARVDLLAAAIVGALMCIYCFLNLAYRGYLSVSLLNSELVGLYRLNIELRAEMFSVLGSLHFGFIFMGIPAVAMVAFCNAARQRGRAWAVLFVALSGALVVLYAATLTKSNILVYGIELVVGARVLGIIRLHGVLAAGTAGLLVLAGLTALLAGTNALDLSITAYNVLFREASDVPFYLAVFPSQIPFVGIDLGLQSLGIGPTAPTNQIVSNFMFPHATWVQGAAPAAAHVMAYAQGGYLWAFATMILVGSWIAVAGQLKRWIRNPVRFSAFIGSVTTCYYLSQGDLLGAFNVDYGYKWWVGALLALVGVQRVLQVALRPRASVLPAERAVET